MIRKNDAEGCPFGLRIPFGCHRAGCCVKRLAPLKILGENASEEEKNQIVMANRKFLNWMLMEGTNEEITQCPYGAKIFDDKEAVECNYEDTAPGEDQKNALMAAPFYSQIFSGIGLNGLYSYPIGYYADYNISRSLYYGMYSMQGSQKQPELIKISEELNRISKIIDAVLAGNKTE